MDSFSNSISVRNAAVYVVAGRGLGCVCIMTCGEIPFRHILPCLSLKLSPILDRDIVCLPGGFVLLIFLLFSLFFRYYKRVIN